MPDEPIESPLESLIDKPLHLMSDEELRSFIRHKITIRDSSQARAAYFRGGVEDKPKTEAFGGLEL